RFGRKRNPAGAGRGVACLAPRLGPSSVIRQRSSPWTCRDGEGAELYLPLSGFTLPLQPHREGGHPERRRADLDLTGRPDRPGRPSRTPPPPPAPVQQPVGQIVQASPAPPARSRNRPPPPVGGTATTRGRKRRRATARL